MLTDYALAVATAAMGVALLRRGEPATPVRLWGCAFLALAFASLLGGTYHGFRSELSDPALAFVWQVNLYAIGAFGLLVVTGTAYLLTAPTRIAVISAMSATFALYTAWMTRHDAFIYVIYFNATVMAMVLAIHAYTFAERRDPSSPWIIAGVAVSALAAIVQASGISISRHFNHNDLFHVIQIAGAYLLYRGARQLRPAAPS
jgi:hypothetical protein